MYHGVLVQGPGVPRDLDKHPLNTTAPYPPNINTGFANSESYHQRKSVKNFEKYATFLKKSVKSKNNDKRVVRSGKNYHKLTRRRVKRRPAVEAQSTRDK